MPLPLSKWKVRLKGGVVITVTARSVKQAKATAYKVTKKFALAAWLAKDQPKTKQVDPVELKRRKAAWRDWLESKKPNPKPKKPDWRQLFEGEGK